MSFKSFAQILILAILLSLVYSQKQFTGTLTITNDPNMGAGSLLNVKIFYDATNQLIRYDYPDLRDPNSSSNGFSELYDFKNQIFYQLCSVCSVYTNAMPIPIFYTETNDIKASSQSNKLPFTLNSKNCDPFQKQNVPDGGITYIWATPDGLICRAERTDGLTYNFDISKTVIGQPAATNFVPPNGSKCPTLPRCKTPIDLVLVLDESGSIHRDEWAQLSTFATGVVNSFIIGPNDTQIGLVYFSGVQYATGEDPASCCGLSDPALNMNFDADTINKFLITHQQTGGHTCINCGIKTATTYEPNRNRPIQVPKVMLVLTDGFNNRMQDFFLIDIQNAKDAGWNMFAIGVNNASVTQLTQIASKPEQVFKIDNFDQLETIAKSVTYKLCGAFPTLSPCGPICKGKCGCGGQCICPKCVSPDNCTVSECVNGVSGSQCLFTPKFCDPFATNNDLCKQNICDIKTGNCTVVPKNCSSLLPDTCYTQTCDPKIGCTLSDKCPPIQNQPGTSTPSLCFSRVCESGKCSVTPKNCTTGANACAVNSCDATLGCISSPINCDDNNMCTTDTCDKVIGCVHTTIDCPSKEFLNSTSYKNNLCLSYKCDPKVGCTSTPKSCDDNNVCTTDNCDPSTGKCSNLAITCPVTTNNCSVTQCDAKAGCIVTPLNCDDNNFCTDDSCDATTGKCKNVPVVCPASNDTCSQNVCDSTARKCVKKPKTICDQPTTKCQINSCTANGTCAASAYNCPPPDLCSTSSCDPILGCIFSPKVCDDKNNCTKDSCDLNSGSCVFTPIPGCTTNVTCLPNCTSTNPCITATCLNGNCVFIPFTCPINLCATITATVVNGTCQCTPSNPKTCGGNKTACGESVCNPSTGLCGTVNNKVCDDNDPCTIDTCVLVGSTATCNYTQITCGNDSPCSRKKCVATNGQPTCVDSPILNAVNCTSTACAVGVCNPASGKCDFTSTNCANPSNTTCARNVCNPVTSKCEASAGLSCPATDPVGCGTGGVCVLQGGVQSCQYNPTCQSTENACVSKVCKVFSNATTCQEVNFTCDDNNPCTIDKCVNDGVDDKGNPKSKCVSTPFSCPANLDNPCKTNQCVNVGGKPTCQLTDIGCNSTSLCIVGKCVVESGKGVCKYNETNCGTPDKCFNYACDPATGCKKISKCNDGNPCTNDLCDTKTGNCTYTQKFCNSSSICQKGVCDPNVGCVQQPLDCVLDKNMTVLDKCHFAICSNTTGCTIAVVPNSLDACGFCNQPGKCAIGRKSTVPAGAIAGAVIGGAIIAGIVALGIGLFAAGGGAAAFTPATQPQMMGGSNNPLYTDGDSGGTNPFDDNDYVPL